MMCRFVASGLPVCQLIYVSMESVFLGVNIEFASKNWKFVLFFLQQNEKNASHILSEAWQSATLEDAPWTVRLMEQLRLPRNKEKMKERGLDIGTITLPLWRNAISVDKDRQIVFSAIKALYYNEDTRRECLGKSRNGSAVELNIDRCKMKEGQFLIDVFYCYSLYCTGNHALCKLHA